jgi:hypothetical protein
MYPLDAGSGGTAATSTKCSPWFNSGSGMRRRGSFEAHVSQDLPLVLQGNDALNLMQTVLDQCREVFLLPPPRPLENPCGEETQPSRKQL